MLVYGVKAVLPIELELPSLRISVAADLSPSDQEYVKNRVAALEILEEQRHETQKKLRKYHEQAKLLYNQQVRPRKFKVGMLVLVCAKFDRISINYL